MVYFSSQFKYSFTSALFMIIVREIRLRSSGYTVQRLPSPIFDNVSSHKVLSYIFQLLSIQFHTTASSASPSHPPLGAAHQRHAYK